MDFWIICVPFGHDDEPEILRYTINSICPTGADVRHPRAFSKAFRAALKRRGLPLVRFHDLRHGHASHLLKQGIHPKVVSDRLGHASVSITLDVYSHVLPGLEEDAMLKLDRALRVALSDQNKKRLSLDS